MSAAWKIVRFLGLLGVLGLPFLAAGRLDWPRAWLFWAVLLASFVLNGVIVNKANPDLFRRRMQAIRPTWGFDKIFLRLTILAFLALFVVAGLDAGRFGWFPLGWEWFYAGVALHFVGDIPVVWVTTTNPFAETTVRIQTERGHRVITTGPYEYVRHPMYVGGILMFTGWPLMLGSAWALLPVAAFVVLLLWRAAREDETLRRELPGYEAYARKTRYRIVPGVW